MLWCCIAVVHLQEQEPGAAGPVYPRPPTSTSEWVKAAATAWRQNARTGILTGARPGAGHQLTELVSREALSRDITVVIHHTSDPAGVWTVEDGAESWRTGSTEECLAILERTGRSAALVVCDHGHGLSAGRLPSDDRTDRRVVWRMGVTEQPVSNLAPTLVEFLGSPFSATTETPQPDTTSAPPVRSSEPVHWDSGEGGAHHPSEQLEDVRISDDSVSDYRRKAARAKLLSAAQETELSKEIEAGLMAQAVLDGVVHTDVVVDAFELRQVVRAGLAAHEKFVASNLRLVVHLASRYQGHGLDLGDLIQEGNLGLLRAVSKFDFRTGYKFSTYATWWIRQRITRALADSSRTIRYPVHVVEELRKLEVAGLRGDTSQSAQALAERTGLALDKILDLLALPRVVEPGLESFTEWERESGWTPFGKEEFEEALVERISMASLLAGLLAPLPARESDIILRRMGFVTGEPETLEAIGVVHGVTRERIRQLERSALDTIRSSVL